MRPLRRTTLITVGCASLLVGLGLARRYQFMPSEWLLIFWPLLLLLKKKNTISLLLIMILGLGLGLWRGSLWSDKLAQINRLSGQEVTITSIATSDAVYSNNYQLSFTGNNVKLIDPYNSALAGNIKISGFGVKAVYRGDKVRVQGKLYPSRGSNQARLSYAQLETVQPGRSWFADFARRFSVGMQNALPEPLASFGMGLLVGQRTNLPKNIADQLTAVGLVHIVAVSGYNLTILVRAIQRLKPRSKYQQLVASLALVALFISVSGFSASIVRAAVVSTLGLWAWYYGRKIKPLVLISFAAALTAMVNPFYVWGDLSWYLSFLAFFGVMIIAPAIQARFFRRQPKFLTIVVLESLSAELMTLPLIMLSFSQLSLVALLANMLIVPLVPAAMLLSALAATAGSILPPLAGWVALPARLTLTFMLDVVHMLASIPSVLVHASINVGYMLSFYAILLSLVLILYKRSSKNNSLKMIK